MSRTPDSLLIRTCREPHHRQHTRSLQLTIHTLLQASRHPVCPSPGVPHTNLSEG